MVVDTRRAGLVTRAQTTSYEMSRADRLVVGLLMVELELEHGVAVIRASASVRVVVEYDQGVSVRIDRQVVV